MKHDPLCLTEVTCEMGCCQCDLIAKVRADTLDKAKAEIG